VLDEDDRNTHSSNDCNGLKDLGHLSFGRPRKDLVQQNHPGPSRQGPCDLELFENQSRQSGGSGLPLAGKSHEFQYRIAVSQDLLAADSSSKNTRHQQILPSG
jgi:hypothetical protein